MRSSFAAPLRTQLSLVVRVGSQCSCVPEQLESAMTGPDSWKDGVQVEAAVSVGDQTESLSLISIKLALEQLGYMLQQASHRLQRQVNSSRISSDIRDNIDDKV